MTIALKGRRRSGNHPSEKPRIYRTCANPWGRSSRDTRNQRCAVASSKHAGSKDRNSIST